VEGVWGHGSGSETARLKRGVECRGMVRCEDAENLNESGSFRPGRRSMRSDNRKDGLKESVCSLGSFDGKT